MRLLLCLLIWTALLIAPPPAPAAVDLAALIREVEKQFQGASSEVLMTMQVKTSHWERNLEMESWSLGREHFLVRILSPAKEKGVGTLKVRREVWNYLPKVDRVIKIPPSMMGGAWMGSHITNDDLVKANHIDEDYTFNLLKEDENRWEIEGIPRPDAPVIWGRIVYALRKNPRVPERVDYYDEERVLVRQILFDDVQQVGDRIIPLRMTVLPKEKPEERTLIHYRKVRFDVPLSESDFNLGRLKSR